MYDLREYDWLAKKTMTLSSEPKMQIIMHAFDRSDVKKLSGPPTVHIEYGEFFCVAEQIGSEYGH